MVNFIRQVKTEAMNQTKQEAAEAYAESSPYASETYTNSEIAKVEIQAFTAGAEWASLKWVSIKIPDRPANGQKVLILVRSMFDGEKEISTFTYSERMGLSESTVIAWAEIPDSILNFKP